MPAGDWASGSVFVINSIRNVPGPSRTIDHCEVEYVVQAPSGARTSRVWKWIPPAAFPAGWVQPANPQESIQKLANLLIADLQTYEGINMMPAPPVISAVKASGITNAAATITWTTDTASDTLVEYGTSVAYGSKASATARVTSHSQALSGLAASTLYHYRVTSVDQYGQVSVSGDFTFSTTV